MRTYFCPECGKHNARIVEEEFTFKLLRNGKWYSWTEVVPMFVCSCGAKWLTSVAVDRFEELAKEIDG